MSKKILEKITINICIAIFICLPLFLLIPMAARVYVKIFDKSNSVINFIFKSNPEMTKKNNQSESTQTDNTQNLTWEILYPYDDEVLKNEINETKSLNNKNIQEEEKFIFPRTFSKIENIKDKTQNWINSFYLFKQKFVEVATKCEYIIKWNLNIPSENSFDGFEILPNGYFTNLIPKKNTKINADSVIEFNNFLKKQNTKLFFLNAPYKYSSNETYKKEFSFVKENSDEFINYLKSENVSFINFRDEIYKDKKDFYEYFYKTDHHWKAESGLWATQKIAKTLSNETNVKIEQSLFDEKNFNNKIYKNGFLGSLGRKATLLIAKPDDFNLITPNFITDFDVNCSTFKPNDEILSGEFIDTIMLQSELPHPNMNYYETSAYNSYSHGDGNIFIKNKLSKNNHKILLMGDSFKDVVAPFLSLGVKQLDVVDLRYFTGSIRCFIKQNGPYDAVLILQNEGILGSNDVKSTNSLWNFD